MSGPISEPTMEEQYLYSLLGPKLRALDLACQTDTAMRDEWEMNLRKCIADLKQVEDEFMKLQDEPLTDRTTNLDQQRMPPQAYRLFTYKTFLDAVGDIILDPGQNEEAYTKALARCRKVGDKYLNVAYVFRPDDASPLRSMDAAELKETYLEYSSDASIKQMLTALILIRKAAGMLARMKELIEITNSLIEEGMIGKTGDAQSKGLIPELHDEYMEACAMGESKAARFISLASHYQSLVDFVVTVTDGN